MKSMKRRNGKCALALLSAVLLLLPLAGCGEELVDMTDSEEEEVVTYAAHIVSKYNKKQPDGISRVIIMPEEETGIEEPEAEEPAAPEPTEIDMSDFEDLPTTTGTNMDAPTLDAGAAAMELSDILRLDGFSFEWTDTRIMDDFLDPTSTMLFTPDAGKRYVLLTITITNTSDGDKICDIPEVTPDFKLIVNGNERISASTTLSDADFRNFQGTVPAGESAEAMLFFQRKASDISDADNYSLEVTLNGVTGRVSEK